MIDSAEQKYKQTARMAARCLWALGAVLCAAYFLGAFARSGIGFDSLADLPKLYVFGLKAFTETALVLAAVLAASDKNARRLSVYIGLIFIADMILATGNVLVSGAVFAFAHIFATIIFWTTSDARPEGWLVTAPALPLYLVVSLCAFTGFTGEFKPIAAFPAFSALATLAAFKSDYPARRTGVGVLMLWVSDLVFVSAILLRGDAMAVGWLVWFSFSSGLLLLTASLIFRPDKSPDDTISPIAKRANATRPR